MKLANNQVIFIYRLEKRIYVYTFLFFIFLWRHYISEKKRVKDWKKINAVMLMTNQMLMSKRVVLINFRRKVACQTVNLLKFKWYHAYRKITNAIQRIFLLVIVFQNFSHFQTQKNVLLNQQKFDWPNKFFRLNMGQWKFCLK